MTRNPLACDVVARLLERGQTLSTAESCTGGGIGAEITAVPGSSQVFLGGVISYTNGVKQKLLGVSGEMLEELGAVSVPVAEAMAQGARRATGSGCAVSVTGLAGPSGDEYGNPVGTVFLGFADGSRTVSREYHFPGDRAAVREAAVQAALSLVLEMLK